MKIAISLATYPSIRGRRLINLSRINPYSKHWSFEPDRNWDEYVLSFNQEASLCFSVVAVQSSSLMGIRYTGANTPGATQYMIKDVHVVFLAYEWQRLVAALGVISGEDNLSIDCYGDTVSIETRMIPVIDSLCSSGQHDLFNEKSINSSFIASSSSVKDYFEHKRHIACNTDSITSSTGTRKYPTIRTTTDPTDDSE